MGQFFYHLPAVAQMSEDFGFLTEVSGKLTKDFAKLTEVLRKVTERNFRVAEGP